MIAYASNTSNPRNIAALRKDGWRVLIVPGGEKHANGHPPPGMRFAIDNGAWSAHQQGRQFDERGFSELIERYGSLADFVVVPDIVAAGERSLEFSERWLPRLKGLRQLLLPVQDGMTVDAVRDVLHAHPGLGIFLGGSTEWKLSTMYQWGTVAHVMLCYFHIARVNSARRIRLSAEAGANSFDGSGASRYSQEVPLLSAARENRSLLTPSLMSASYDAA